MADEYLSCPFCGFEFAKADTLCHHGCPLGALCHLNRCPNCQYEFAEQPRAVSWLESLFRKDRRPVRDLPEHVLSVRDLRGGERGRVICLGTGGESRHNNLAVFGVVPGAEVTAIQQRPSCVLRVGETELALDPAIAREILVERLEPDPVPT
ncbi:MAG: ferrous iron transport protein A [Gemmatimonadota bacterium]|nr:ferrous iron transport protein A [Gemmatimonadota bacterium]MDH3369543.1 ferrous iron transport protein A [Gemmatimonadota bacterium]MDH3478236.1 ferrous iron transport protein A [Gemmatimonadota bacterium]MDH3571105.1 ferrous iron transport protein A [Gemmatimonadota bacterium]MDH5550622.1 ferrous iron transport protein A [Gemmatimonadota bacterium]